MKQISIVNNQKEGKYAGTTRTINVPDWLLSGNHADFCDDPDIDVEKAFDALCNYAKQHLPVAFRTKDINAQSCYKWLDGQMVGGSQVRADAMLVLSSAGMDKEVLESKSTKELKSMVELYQLMGGN